MKKILLSLMTLVLVLGLVGAGAFAYFSDTETSSDNTFTAGTLDIGLWESSGSGHKGSAFHTWEWTNLEPGATLSDTLNVWNGGVGVTADAFYIKFNYTLTDGTTPASVSDPGTSVLDKAIKIQTATWGPYVIADSWGYALLNGKTLAELYALGEVQMYANGLPVTLAPNEDADLFITWECDPNADNGIQGDSVDITVTIKAEQE